MAKMDFDLSVSDAAKMLGVSEPTIRRLAAIGTLPYRVRGFGSVRKRMYFRTADCEKVRRQQLNGVAPTCPSKLVPASV